MHVIITGGSSGIGAAIADLYAERGANVSLIARTESRLEAKRRELDERYPGRDRQFRCEPGDVRDGAALRKAIDRCEAALGPCDVLVAAAGTVDPAPFEVLPQDRFDAQIATNLFGTANAVRAVLAGMKQRGRGKILIIGSGSGLVGLFGYTAYCASKAGLIGFAEALRQETRPHGVAVSICLPPDTDTPQLAAELPLRPAEARAIMGSGPGHSALAVARAAVRGLERGKPVTHPGLQIKLLARWNFVAPLLRYWFDRRIVKATGKPTRPEA